MDQQLLVVSGVRKRFGTKEVLKGLSLSLGAGNFAVVGPNGAGKSTLLKVLTGAIAADSGTIVVDGVDLMEHSLEAKRRFAYVPDKPLAYRFLLGRDFLSLVAGFRRVRDTVFAEELVDRFGLGPFLGKRFDAMSLGTQRKFFLVAAFMGEPKLLFMDEPTNALDKHSRSVLQELLVSDGIHRLGFFASHDDDFIKEVGATCLHLEGGVLDRCRGA